MKLTLVTVMTLAASAAAAPTWGFFGNNNNQNQYQNQNQNQNQNYQNQGQSQNQNQNQNYQNQNQVQVQSQNQNYQSSGQQTAYCDTGAKQVQVDTAFTNAIFGALTLPLTILGLVAQANNQIIQLGVNAATDAAQKAIQQKQVFTQNLVAHMRQQYPSHSVVVCQQGSYSFDSKPIQKTTVQCSTVSGPATYDVIVFDKGNFNLRGAGGFHNWAYIPNSYCKYGGNQVNC